MGLPKTPSYDVLVQQAKSLLQRGQTQRGLEVAKKAVEKNRHGCKAQWALGLGFAQMGKLQLATKHYELARVQGCTDRDLFLELASIYDVSKQYKNAVTIYSEYLSKHPHDAEMRQELGLTWLLLKDYEAATNELEAASALQPTNLQIAQDHGYALLLKKDFVQAVEVLADVVKKAPKKQNAIILLVRAYVAQGLYDQAMQVLDQVLIRNENNVQLKRMHAEMLQKRGKKTNKNQ